MKQTADCFENLLQASTAYIEIRAMLRQCPDSVQRFLQEMEDQSLRAPEASDDRQRACAAIAAALMACAPTSSMPRPASRHAKSLAFAEQLKALRKAKGMTQEQLATAVGLRQSTISMMERRQCRPESSTLAKLAEHLGVATDQLWPPSDKPANGQPGKKKPVAHRA